MFHHQAPDVQFAVSLHILRDVGSKVLHLRNHNMVADGGCQEKLKALCPLGCYGPTFVF